MSKKSPITTHILDVSLGKPASGVSCRLEKLDEKRQWNEVGRGTTNQEGRLDQWMSEALTKGMYRIDFVTGPYFEQQKRRSFYPTITIQFEVVEPTEHYHVPLLLSPFGFSTYRGS